MSVKLINIGFGNIVAAERVIAIVGPESAPVKRVVADARENGTLVDGTCGRRTRAVIVTDSRHVILSALLPETIGHRFGETGVFPNKDQPSMEEEAGE